MWLFPWKRLLALENYFVESKLKSLCIKGLWHFIVLRLSDESIKYITVVHDPWKIGGDIEALEKYIERTTRTEATVGTVICISGEGTRK